MSVQTIDLGRVHDAMSTDVVRVPVGAELSDAARLLEHAGISGAPVVDDGKVVGVVTLKDIFTRLPIGRTSGLIQTTGSFPRWEHVLAEMLRNEPVSVAEVMTHQVVMTRADAPLIDAVSLMVDHGINRLPVVDDEGKVCGILSRGDVMRAVARQARR